MGVGHKDDGEGVAGEVAGEDKDNIGNNNNHGHTLL
jgi:hypothetical protein